MEVLIRWACRCESPKELCRFCNGNGYLERWASVELIRYFARGQFVIRGRRFVDSPSGKTGVA